MMLLSTESRTSTNITISMGRNTLDEASSGLAMVVARDHAMLFHRHGSSVAGLFNRIMVNF